MLFVIRDLRVLILVSCCCVYSTDLALNRLKVCLNADNIIYDVVWFSGAYELGWLLNVNAVRYCACVVLGFAPKRANEHSAHVVACVYNTISNCPVVDAIQSLDCVEQAWWKAFSLNANALIVSLKSLLGANVGVIVRC
ncbi:6,7-dimethyl-8-ribityllumazine synthase [Candidatus Hodgkinia cicadicola]|nr:6,7-dimethyl-8-ribityllumazine synthase [Candidatus Hodgkinia cicadicola]